MGVDPKSKTVSAILMEILLIIGLPRRPYWNPIWRPQGAQIFGLHLQNQVYVSILYVYQIWRFPEKVNDHLTYPPN